MTVAPPALAAHTPSDQDLSTFSGVGDITTPENSDKPDSLWFFPPHRPSCQTPWSIAKFKTKGGKTVWACCHEWRCASYRALRAKTEGEHLAKAWAGQDFLQGGYVLKSSLPAIGKAVKRAQEASEFEPDDPRYPTYRWISAGEDDKYVWLVTNIACTPKGVELEPIDPQEALDDWVHRIEDGPVARVDGPKVSAWRPPSNEDDEESDTVSLGADVTETVEIYKEAGMEDIEVTEVPGQPRPEITFVYPEDMSVEDAIEAIKKARDVVLGLDGPEDPWPFGKPDTA